MLGDLFRVDEFYGQAIVTIHNFLRPVLYSQLHFWPVRGRRVSPRNDRGRRVYLNNLNIFEQVAARLSVGQVGSVIKGTLGVEN